MGWHIGNTVGNALRLGVNINPAESCCSSLGVLIARLGSINADVIGYTQLYLTAIIRFYVSVGNG